MKKKTNNYLFDGKIVYAPSVNPELLVDVGYDLDNDEIREAIKIEAELRNAYYKREQHKQNKKKK